MSTEGYSQASSVDCSRDNKGIVEIMAWDLDEMVRMQLIEDGREDTIFRSGSQYGTFSRFRAIARWWRVKALLIRITSSILLGKHRSSGLRSVYGALGGPQLCLGGPQ